MKIIAHIYIYLKSLQRIAYIDDERIIFPTFAKRKCLSHNNILLVMTKMFDFIPDCMK